MRTLEETLASIILVGMNLSEAVLLIVVTKSRNDELRPVQVVEIADYRCI